MPLRRKKWTEEEEETLISKYGDLLRSGSLSKMKSRERKFQPIATHVNSLYHSQNSISYPWLWTWKDASTKVQNMRHQYLGVKQKIRKLVVSSLDPSGHEEVYEWEDGLSHWSNFLRYKEVFGDQDLELNDFFTNPNPNPDPNPNLNLRGALRHQHQRQQHRHHHHHHHKQHIHHCPQAILQYRPDSSAGTANNNNNSSSNNNSGMHSLSKDFIDNDVVNLGGTQNSSGLLLPPMVKETTIVNQAVLAGDSGDLTNGLGFAYDDDDDCEDDDCEDEHGRKDRDENYEDENDDNGDGDNDDDDMHYNRKKRKRQWVKPQIGVMNTSEDRILSAMGGHFAMLLEREARREKIMLEWEKEREMRLSLIEAEISKQKKEWERERREMEETRQRETEKREAERQEHDMIDQQRREVDRARDERMERERMEWREKIESQAMQHQTAMMQIQLQIAQSQQNTIAMLSGGLLQLVGQGNDFTSQGNSVSPFISQLIQNMQAHSSGMVQCGIRRGAGESSDSQFDVDG